MISESKALLLLEMGEGVPGPQYIIHGSVGVDLDETAERLVKLAKFTGAVVTTTFNGIELHASPWSHSKRALIRQYEIVLKMQSAKLDALRRKNRRGKKV